MGTYLELLNENKMVRFKLVELLSFIIENALDKVYLHKNNEIQKGFSLNDRLLKRNHVDTNIFEENCF